MSHITFTCPWPAAVLSPNSRVHWAKKAKARKQQRWQACSIVLAAGGRGLRGASRVNVAMDFLPPDRRRRDMDNLLASCKGLLDGIADALGVDDSRFAITLALTSEPVKFGGVRVTIGRAT